MGFLSWLSSNANPAYFGTDYESCAAQYRNSGGAILRGISWGVNWGDGISEAEWLEMCQDKFSRWDSEDPTLPENISTPLNSLIPIALLFVAILIYILFFWK